MNGDQSPPSTRQSMSGLLISGLLIISRLLIISSLLATVVLACGISLAQDLDSDIANAANPTNETHAKQLEFFEQQVVPILKRRCYECHSHASAKAKGGLVLDSRQGWEQGGVSGKAIVPSQPEESLLIAAVRYEGLEMPPQQKLPAAEIAVLEKWVSLGAPDQRKSPERKFDPQKLWALQPIQRSEFPRPEIPTEKPAGSIHNEIDLFIQAKRQQQGLESSPKAERHPLLRRLTFDLTGLPPTPSEIEAFMADQSDQAYENVVDRLLNSVAFGDHWARHWFDLSCYADLADIDGNILIRDAWRYRDYVIQAFNTDKPLDRFIHEQIAGDLLPYTSIEQQREQIIATGYLAIGPWTLQNYIKGQLDADVVDHQIDRIGRTFLGQTISCARCHDHKFDPVPTRDYYALAGIFHSTRTTSYDGPGVWSQITQVPLPELPGAAAEFERLAQETAGQRETLRLELAALQRTEAEQRFKQKVVNPNANSLTLATGIAANAPGQMYQVSFNAGPSVWADGSQATGPQDGLLLQILRKDDSVLASHVYRAQAWSGMANPQQLRKDSFTYQGDGSGEIRLLITSSNHTGRFSGAIDDLAIADAATSTVLFEEHFHQSQLGAIRGQQANTGLPVYAGCVTPGWIGGGINHSHMVDLGEAGQPNMVLQIYSGPPIPSDNPQIVKISGELVQLARLLESARPQQSQALAVKDIPTPHDFPIYQRGSFQSPGEIAPRGFLSAVPVSTQFVIPPGQSGRLQLAQWLTDPENPLTPRVLVNRVWHHLFGKGLVRTVDYFGVHGETPSHPELLDFLALQLQGDDQWSLKKTVRRMVLSQTYQLSSAYNAKGAAEDPDNRWLWQMPRRRLGAESIREAMLMVSGELNPGRGGPSLGLELNDNIRGAGGNVNPATWGGHIADEIKQRRSVYLPLQRQRPMGDFEILSTFDFPHPSEIVGARPNTTVATQALFLINAPFVKHQAVKLAERLVKEEPDDRLRINRLYLLTASRPAESDEIESALTFLDHCTQDLTAAAGNEKARLSAWAELCHAVLGSNNFLFLE